MRFAPSPTGRFHVGNLRTAWISHQLARVHGLPWIVRMEDIDGPRVVSGMQAQQLADMAALNMIPDLLLVQSQFRARHWQVFLNGILSGQIYPCNCSRREVQIALTELASAAHDNRAPIYSGRCRHRQLTAMTLKSIDRPADSLAWRFRMADETGRHDFIVARTSADFDSAGATDYHVPEHFVPAYHLACAIDDSDGQYDLIVRAHDLSTALPLQQAIQLWFGSLDCDSSLPAVFHTSLVVQNDSKRLEKRTQGVTLAELQKNGVSTGQLLWRFQQSFDLELLRAELKPGLIIAEANPTVSLQDLSLA